MVAQKVLFICLGNICRSPIAEAVFLHLIEQKGLQDKWLVDSAAITGWHAGSRPDSRALTVLKKNGINYNGKARQITKADFSEFNFIFGMDEENMEYLKKNNENGKAKLYLLGDFDPEGERIIRDPYYDSDTKGFEKCYEQCVRCCEAFLKQNSQ